MGQEVVISDYNANEFINPVVDGEQKAMGCIPRDFMRCPVGYLPQARPFDLEIIPASERAAMLQNRIDTKAQLSDIRNISGPDGGPIPSTDQNGKGYCHTADTEVLTEQGWVAWENYDFRSPIATVNPVTHAMEFQRPREKHVYEYDGEMVHSTNRRLDFGVTPDHQMYVRKWDEAKRTLSDKYSFVRAGDMGWYAGLLAAPTGRLGTDLVELEIPGDRRYDGDDFVALVAMICADGFAADYAHGGRLVSFCCFDPKRIEGVRAMAHRVGFKEQPSRPGVFNRWGAGELMNWVFQNCYIGDGRKAGNKAIPGIIKEASRRQIKLFLNTFGDKNRDGQDVYYSTSKRMVDDLQQLHLQIGIRSTISSVGPRETVLNGKTIRSKSSYRLCVAGGDSLSLERKKHIETDRYKGLVYCAGVPNHTLMTRRNGSVLISSNCWAHSSTSAALIARAVMGQPYVDLSAFAIACMIKNFRDEGGWNSQSVEFIAERGVPTGKYWPQRSMSRANDNENTWKNAAKHKFVKWMDLEPRNMKEQLITCLLLGYPVVSDFNWWGHSVLTLELVSLSPFRTRIWNSWGDSWSDNGTGILEGNRAIPDAAIAIQVAAPSQD